MVHGAHETALNGPRGSVWALRISYPRPLTFTEMSGRPDVGELRLLHLWPLWASESEFAIKSPFFWTFWSNTALFQSSTSCFPSSFWSDSGCWIHFSSPEARVSLLWSTAGNSANQFWVIYGVRWAPRWKWERRLWSRWLFVTHASKMELEVENPWAFGAEIDDLELLS